MTEPMSHERARQLAASRLDEALSEANEAALNAHLATCASCRASAAGYEADRLALRALPPIEPPRDLWARTSTALEREHARHPRVARRTPRRWGPVAVLGSGFALVLVIAIVGPTLLGTRSSTGVIALATGGAVGPAASSLPGITPLTVPTSQVTWVVTKGSGGLTLETASVNKVCPTGDEPDCAPLAGISRSLASLPTVPSSLVLSPSNAGQAVAIASTPFEPGGHHPVRPDRPGPAVAERRTRRQLGRASGGPPVPAVGPAASPAPRASETAGRGPPALADLADPCPPSAAEPIVGRVPLGPSASLPPLGPTPAPSAAAALAILSNVTLVGDEAAYSADGLWFAFSARPAGTSTGPDINTGRPVASGSAEPPRLRLGLRAGSTAGSWPAGQSPSQPPPARRRVRRAARDRVRAPPPAATADRHRAHRRPRATAPGTSVSPSASLDASGLVTPGASLGPVRHCWPGPLLRT